LAVPPLRWLYDYAWFIGFAVSAATYLLVTRATPVRDSAEREEALRGGELGD
jgi:NCS1 family nucleobase:cation symporter-1